MFFQEVHTLIWDEMVSTLQKKFKSIFMHENCYILIQTSLECVRCKNSKCHYHQYVTVKPKEL